MFGPFDGASRIGVLYGATKYFQRLIDPSCAPERLTQKLHCERITRYRPVGCAEVFECRG